MDQKDEPRQSEPKPEIRKNEPGANREPPEFDGVSKEALAEKKEFFRGVLNLEKSKLIKNAQRTLTEDMTLDPDDLPDEMDLATADYQQGLAFRLRGRERLLIEKIDQAIERLDKGDYWWCENCSSWIGFNRLSARPVTTLCIQCKSQQEHRERAYAD